MQKLKKSLENHNINLVLKESNNNFIIENTVDFSKLNIKKNYIKESKVLTTRFSKQIKFFDLLDISKLKYPLKLNTFSTLNNFEDYLANIEKTSFSLNLILIKKRNLIFKNKNYSLLKYNTANLVVNRVILSSFIIFKFVKVLKFRYNKDK